MEPTQTRSNNGEFRAVQRSQEEIERSMAADPRERGKTFISDEVVSVIARIAAEQVEGVYQLGESSFRTLLSRLGRSHGIDSEVGMKEAAVDISIVAEFGYPLREVAGELRERVINAVEQMTGRAVVEVNVHIGDIHVPRMDTRATSRRQLE